MRLPEDEQLASTVACLLPILVATVLLGLLLLKRFVTSKCPECDDTALVRIQEFPAWHRLLATYGCSKCTRTCVKFLLR